MSSTTRAHLILVCHALLGVQLLACSPPPAVLARAPEGTHPPSATRSEPARAGEEGPACERVKRASRIYTGFAGEVSLSLMYVALDAIRPIEDRLGRLFCAEELAPCRPPHLTTIILADELPSQARVTVEGGPTAQGKTFELVLLKQADDWRPEPTSLAEILAPCGGVGAAR